jgi:hypothetical protein
MSERYTMQVTLTVSIWSDGVPNTEDVESMITDAIDNNTESLQAWNVKASAPEVSEED